MGWFLDWWREIGLVGQIMACAAIPTSIILLLQAIMMLIGAGFGSDSDDFDSDGSDAGADGYDLDSTDFSAGEFDGDVSGVEFDGFDGDASGVEVDGFDGGASGFGHDIFHGGDYHGSDAGSSAGFSHAAAGHKTGGTRMFTVRGIIAFFAIGGWAGLAALTSGVAGIWSVQISLLAGVAAMILSHVVIRFALRMQSSGNIDLRNAISQTAEVYITIPPSRSETGKIMMLLQERLVEIDAVTDDSTAIKPHTIVEVVGQKDTGCLVVRRTSNS